MCQAKKDDAVKEHSIVNCNDIEAALAQIEIQQIHPRSRQQLSISKITRN